MKLLEQIRHPNIILLLGIIIEQPNTIGIVMEYMENKSLSLVLNSSKIVLNEVQKVGIALQVAQAMHYLHTCNPPIIHRDLKSGNCLVDEYFRVKLCDFGISKVRKDQQNYSTKTVSTYQYMAPETISKSIYTTKTDVYAFGILLWEIWTRKIAYEHLQPIQIIYSVVDEVIY
jgi:serine/threonine protein kinase